MAPANIPAEPMVGILPSSAASSFDALAIACFCV